MKLTATRRVEQSIRILKFLASVQEGRVSAKAIADATSIAPDTVRQLMQVLARSKLVTSLSGPTGGYWLSCVPASTSMRTVVEACEGPINPMFCDLAGIPCGRVNRCALHAVWSASQKTLALELSTMSLAEILATVAA